MKIVKQNILLNNVAVTMTKLQVIKRACPLEDRRRIDAYIEVIILQPHLHYITVHGL